MREYCKQRPVSVKQNATGYCVAAVKYHEINRPVNLLFKYGTHHKHIRCSNCSAIINLMALAKFTKNHFELKPGRQYTLP